MQFSHSGAFELGSGTNFVIIPSADVAIVALTNATPSGIPETLTAEFADLVQFGEVREDWRNLYKEAFPQMEEPEGSLVGQKPPANPRRPRPLGGLRRHLRERFLGSRHGHRTGRQSGIVVRPPRQVWPLTHWDGNVFTFSFVTENAPPGTISKATFDGDKLTLEYYDANHNGVFTR